MILPEWSELDLQEYAKHSAAEVRVYRAFRGRLPDSFLVLHSLRWVLIKENDAPWEGETDFVIADPDRGFLCIEVKGGRIEKNAQEGRWYTRDRNDTPDISGTGQLDS